MSHYYYSMTNWIFRTFSFQALIIPTFAGIGGADYSPAKNPSNIPLLQGNTFWDKKKQTSLQRYLGILQYPISWAYLIITMKSISM